MNSRTIKSIFTSAIMHRNMHGIVNNNEQMVGRCIELKNIIPNKSDWFCDTYNSFNSYDLKQDNIFNPFIEKVCEEVVSFSNEFEIYPKKIKCTDAWFNISSKGQYQEFHYHQLSHFSVVYYLKVPKDSGRLIIRSSESLLDMFPLPNPVQPNILNFKTFTFEPIESDLIIFKSNLHHMVEKNNSDHDRISISLNFVLF